MQNDVSEKRLAKLGVANEEEDVCFLRAEVKRLVELLDEKEKELQIVKKHFEEIFSNALNSRIAINPAPMPGQVTFPGSIPVPPGNSGDIYAGDGAMDGDWGSGSHLIDSEGVRIYTTGDSISHGITNGTTSSDISLIDGVTSSNATSLINNANSTFTGTYNLVGDCNISNNIMYKNDFHNVFRIDSEEDLEDGKEMSLTGM
jgi:hypothetical protein